MESTPLVREKKGISPVWTLPILALFISGWIFYTSYQNAGITITVYFDDASGITPGKTQVITRGIPIGTVSRIIPDLDNRRIKTIIKMDKNVENRLVEDTLFWIVRPEISAASVQGLDTLFSGSYIGFQPGGSTESRDEFIGLASPPPISEDTPGLHVHLRAQALGSIQVGAGVYYKNISIGSITKYSLDENETILINLFINSEYAYLVREGSRFYNASGVNITGKLTNLKVQVESLASLIKGGVVLHTPEALADTAPVQDGYIFPLYKDLESARYGLNMTLQLASSMGITEGETKIIYRGLVAGVVEKIDFNDDERNTVTAQIMLDPRAGRILRKGTQFWIVRPEITTEGIHNLDTLLSGPFITFKPGSGPFQNHFEILPEPPPQQPLRPGSELVLTATQSFAIQKGAPVTYKNKKVGEVLDVELDDQFSTFEILIFIYEQYEELVKPHSVFWNSGGVAMDLDFSGIHVESHSLISMVSGGISFITPDIPQPLALEAAGDIVFPVYGSYADAVASVQSLQPRGYRFKIRTNNDESFRKGSPLYYKRVKVGEITGFKLADDKKHVLIDCFIEESYRDLVNASSRFYDLSGVHIEGSLNGVSMETESLETIIRGGIAFFTPDPTAGKQSNTPFVLYRNRNEAEARDDLQISVIFSQCKDLRKGSPVKYKGVTIGEVLDLQFAENMHDIKVMLRIQKNAAPFFRQNTKIWLEKAEISLSGIKNIKTILFGPYVNVLPGEGGLTKSFTALTEAPSTPADIAGGLDIILVSRHLGSLKINSPVTYRQVKVGKVVEYKLSDTFKDVLIFINIEPLYAPLIRQNTRFWNAAGTRIEGGLFSGISVTTESMEALLTGGIAMATPEKENMGAPAEKFQLFTLHEKAEDGWLDWNPDITLVEEEKKRF